MDYRERSFSKKVMDWVVRASYSGERLDSYRAYSVWMRGLDNIVDEGRSAREAQQVLDHHRRIWNGEIEKDDSPLGQLLITVLKSSLNSTTALHNKQYLSCLLNYFQVDLNHRRSLQSFSQAELQVHTEGGFPACLGSIVALLKRRPILNDGFIKLTRVHGQAEPLGDLTEDLERGFVPHSRDNGAVWVDDLLPEKPVPVDKIDDYVLQRRMGLANEMFRLAGYAALELGGMVGGLMTLEYLRRAVVLARRRYQPLEDVVFAKYRMGD